MFFLRGPELQSSKSLPLSRILKCCLLHRGWQRGLTRTFGSCKAMARHDLQSGSFALLPSVASERLQEWRKAHPRNYNVTISCIRNTKVELAPLKL